MHCACSHLQPRFNHEFTLFPSSASTNGFAVQETPILFSVGPAREDNSLFGTGELREHHLSLQFGIRVLNLHLSAFTFIDESRAFDSITLLDATRNIRVLLPIGGGQVFFRQVLKLLPPGRNVSELAVPAWCSVHVAFHVDSLPAYSPLSKPDAIGPVKT